MICEGIKTGLIRKSVHSKHQVLRHLFSEHMTGLSLGITVLGESFLPRLLVWNLNPGFKFSFCYQITLLVT